MKTKEVQVLKQFYQLENSKSRYVLFRGSTRSGKTVAIIQNLLSKLSSIKNLNIVIGVETLTNAKATIIKDLDEWIYKFNMIKNFKVNKSEFTYEYVPTKSTIRVIPCDKDSKWFGLKADIYWFNEATHINKDVFEQAQMRLPDDKSYNKIILDFNPTNPYSWVRDLENSDIPGGVETFISTYKDNPFLGEKQVKLYETWKETNYNKWLVFGEGEYGKVAGAIYTNWKVVDRFPTGIKYWYGLDFGFTNDPSTLLKIGLQNGEIYIDEIFYERGLTNPDICNLLREENITTQDIIADSAEPKSIEEIRRERFRITGTKKGAGSIINGIDILQRYKLNITKRSKNVQDEIINYTWKVNRLSKQHQNVPVDDWNHALDALRYVALMKLGTKSSGSGIIFR